MEQNSQNYSEGVWFTEIWDLLEIISVKVAGRKCKAVRSTAPFEQWVISYLLGKHNRLKVLEVEILSKQYAVVDLADVSEPQDDRERKADRNFSSYMREVDSVS